MAEDRDRDQTGDVTVVTSDVLRAWPLPRVDGDKDAKGRVLVVGGSESTPGAVLLAAESALRAGAGKVQVATTSGTARHLAVALPEGLVVGLPTASGGIAASAVPRVAEMAAAVDTVLVGPGLTDPQAACALLEGLVPQLEVALVVDALATAYLTAHQDGLARLAATALVTPNVTELAEMTGLSESEVERDPIEAARTASRATGVTVLAGTDSSVVVAASGEVWSSPGGPSAAAVAGSGDVKAGVVAGLRARGAPPAQAAVWGAFLHARVAEMLAATVGPTGFLAREMPPLVPRAHAELGA